MRTRGISASCDLHVSVSVKKMEYICASVEKRATQATHFWIGSENVGDSPSNVMALAGTSVPGRVVTATVLKVTIIIAIYFTPCTALAYDSGVMFYMVYFVMKFYRTAILLLVFPNNHLNIH